MVRLSGQTRCINWMLEEHMKHLWMILLYVGCVLCVAQAFAAEEGKLEVSVISPGARGRRCSSRCWRKKTST